MSFHAKSAGIARKSLPVVLQNANPDFSPNSAGSRKGGASQAAEKRFRAVILSEAKNLGSCSFNELRRSFLRSTQDRLRPLRMTARRVFPQPVKPRPSDFMLKNLGQYVTTPTNLPTAVNIKITERSGNVYENKGRCQEGEGSRD